jgi:hypothetical protein
MNLSFTGHWPLVTGHFVRPTAEQSDVSRPAISDGNRSPLDDNGDGSPAAAEFQHLLELRGVFFHINVLSPRTIGRPGPVRVGSAGFPVDDDLLCHDQILLYDSWAVGPLTSLRPDRLRGER